MAKKRFLYFCGPLLAFALFSNFSCSGKKAVKEITLEPSIERVLEEFETSPEYSYLVKFIKKRRARLEFDENPSMNCVRYDYANGRITIPRKYKESDLFLTLETLKALYIWKTHITFGLEEFLAEEEVLATAQQMHYILALRSDAGNKIFEDEKFIREKLKKEFCSYTILNTQMMSNLIRLRTSVINNDCGLPLETVMTQRSWAYKIKEAMQNEKFFDLMYEKDLLKVRRGLLTMADATRNNAMLRSKPLYEIYRDQRSYYDVSLDKIDKFEKFYKKELEKDKEWRLAHKDEIENARYEFTSCAE